MSKQHAPWILVVALILSWAAWGIAGLLLAALVLGMGYLGSVRLHPRINCRTCKGTGRFYGWVYTWVWRNCHWCLGSGRKIRYGASQWGSVRIRAEASTAKSARESAQRGRWLE